MNRAVVRRTTAGLCSYLLKHVPQASAWGIVIGPVLLIVIVLPLSSALIVPRLISGVNNRNAR